MSIILNKIGYSLKDVSIIPADMSYVNSRSECDVAAKDGTLPIFVSPMCGLTSDKNIDIFKKAGLNPIYPRDLREENELRQFERAYEGEWVALSLNQFEKWFNDLTWNDQYPYFNHHFKICIDTANGNMYSIFSLARKAKQLSSEYHYDITIMVGNIANPETIDMFHAVHEGFVVDYIRVGIGGGQCCTTTLVTGVHYPMASLIEDCYNRLKQYKRSNPRHDVPKLVADGGIRSIDDAIKALALGADYVMLGTIAASWLESDLPNDWYNFSDESRTQWQGVIDNNPKWTIDQREEFIKFCHEQNMFLHRDFYGMASIKGQEIWRGCATASPEGTSQSVLVTDTVHGWIDRFVHSLQSAMSYCNARVISKFRPRLIVNSQTTIAQRKR